MVAGHKEVQKHTEAVISCTVTGLTKQLDRVKWTTGDYEEIATDDGDGYIIDTGSDGFSGDTQITTLTVPLSETDEDKAYICLITSDEHGETDKSKYVNLKVFCKLWKYDIS